MGVVTGSHGHHPAAATPCPQLLHQACSCIAEPATTAGPVPAAAAAAVSAAASRPMATAGPTGAGRQWHGHCISHRGERV